MGPHPALLPRPSSLCQLADMWKGDVPTGGIMAEPKIDGVRGLWIDSELLTREGARIPAAEHIAEACRAIEALAGGPMVIDGEFLVVGDYRATLSHIARKVHERDAGTLHVFDMVPLARWEADDDDRPLYERKRALTDAVEAWERERAAACDDWGWQGHTRSEGDVPLQIMPDEWLADRPEVLARVHEVWRAGGEGLMLKDAEAVYRRSRSAVWQKVKREGWAVRTVPDRVISPR